MLEIKNLSKTYSSGFELNNISLEINKGDFLVMFGPDDAGKTAILYQILGLHQFSRGFILYKEKDIRQLTKEERLKIRFVPDSVCMEEITAREYFAMLSKEYEEYDEEDVLDLCELFEIELDTRLTDMTYNENKLTMIVGALVSVPELLILDEPMNFLTKESSVLLLRILQFLNRRGITILMTCTQVSEVQDYATQYIYLKDGTVSYHGLVKDIYGTQKAVSLSGKDAVSGQRVFGAPIAKSNGRLTYLYDKKRQRRRLTELIGILPNVDVEVENLTLEEILDKDYTRWM